MDYASTEAPECGPKLPPRPPDSIGSSQGNSSYVQWLTYIDLSAIVGAENPSPRLLHEGDGEGDLEKGLFI